MSATETQLKDAQSALIKLLQPHRGSPVMMRVNAYVHEKTGKKLSEFLGGPPSDDDKKLEIIQELTEMLEKGDYSKLPGAPSGQAQQPVAPKPAAPAPKPAVAAAPAPAPDSPEVPEVDLTESEDEDDPEIIEMKLKLAKAKAAKAKAAAAAAAAAAPGLTEEQVRAIIKDEFESDPVRSLIDEAIKAAVDARLAEVLSTVVASLRQENGSTS